MPLCEDFKQAAETINSLGKMSSEVINQVRSESGHFLIEINTIVFRFATGGFIRCHPTGCSHVSRWW